MVEYIVIYVIWLVSSVGVRRCNCVLYLIGSVGAERHGCVLCLVGSIDANKVVCSVFFFFCYNCKVRFDSFSPRWLWWVRRKGSLFCLQSFGLKYRLLIRLMKVGKTSPNHNAFGLNKVCTRKAYGSRQYDLNCKTLMSRYSGAKLWQGRDMLFGLIMW